MDTNTNGKSEHKWGQATLALHYGQESDKWSHKPLMSPIYLTTTYCQNDPGVAKYEYSRSGNPSRDQLENTLAILEGANYGLAMSSGLGALSMVSYLLRPGQNVLCSDDVYGGTNRFLSDCKLEKDITTTFVDGTIVDNWSKAFVVGKTKLVWIETPTNPTLKIIDIEKVSQSIKALDSECLVVVDNTFMTPILQRPLDLGADIVMHSCTKYLNGHSDVIMGCLVTRNKELFEKLKYHQNAKGITPSSFDCYLVTRSLKTLKIRVKQQQASALIIAQFLEKNDHVKKVIYPGLESHPQHELVKKQCKGFGGMVAVYFKDGQTALRVVQNVKVFSLAESLGCVCSLLEIPARMTHTSVPEDQRRRLGIDDSLVRMSLGLEEPEDLIEDLSQALKAKV